MPKHSLHALDFQQRHDPTTGTRITRLTPPERVCHRNYFYQRCFSADGRRLLFGGNLDGGPHWHYHLLDLDRRTALQLTEGEDENTFGGFLSPDDARLWFVRGGRELVRVDLDTLREHRVYEVPAGWVGYGTWVANSDCTRMVGIEVRAEDWFELDDWTKFRLMFEARPRCRLICIDLRDGSRRVVLDEPRWLGHPQFRPGDDRTVAYCHEGPHDRIDARIWFVDDDGSRVRCGHEQASGESCTHEFWVPDGSALVYVSFFRDATERRICRLDPDTLASTTLITMPPCSHLMSNHDGSLIVGDGTDGDPRLYLFDLRAGTQRALARHDSSWRVRHGNRQVTHPHPSFSPDDRQVLFTSDVDGEPALYLADLEPR